MNFNGFAAFGDVKSVVDEAVEQFTVQLIQRFGLHIAERLSQAMCYSLRGGQRLRGILLIIIATTLRPDTFDIAVEVSVALEMMHAYTLIHDDLPIFDNDDIRRGQPSCHIKFNEQIALLAGNALFSTAITKICDLSELEVNKKLAIISSLSAAFTKVMMGQAEDCRLSKIIATEKEIEMLMLYKTAPPFIAAGECGCILSDAPVNDRSKIARYCEIIGHAYQILDDIADADDQKKEINVVKTLGVDHAIKRLEELRQEASQILNDTRWQILHDFFAFICSLVDMNYSRST